MRLLTRNGSSLPLWMDDFLYYGSIATSNYDPIATYQAGAKTSVLNAVLWEAIKGGFAVKNATADAGYIYAITWRQFEDYRLQNKQLTEATWDLSAIVPRQIYLLGGEFALTPIVKVFAGNDATYKSTVATINVGKIL